MKLSYPCLTAAAIMQLFTFTICKAQSSKSIGTLQAPPAKIVVDGDIKEWGDSLRYYNAEKAINYAIANTRDTLYMAVRISDRTEQTRILHAGITFSVDPKGRKKEAFSITFPLSALGSQPLTDLHKDDGGEITRQDRDELRREQLTTLRGIKVEGFKDIEGDMITTSNTYGIQTAISYDDKGFLVCEAAIPLKFFNAGDLTKNEWAFNFKINGIQRKPAAENADKEEQGGGRGGRGGGMGGGGRGGHGGRGGSRGSSGETGLGELGKSEDFWEKFYLAK